VVPGLRTLFGYEAAWLRRDQVPGLVVTALLSGPPAREGAAGVADGDGRAGAHERADEHITRIVHAGVDP
jgi:hypothetical protein